MFEKNLMFKLLLLALGVLSVSDPSFACTCAELSPRERADMSELVFTGIVTGISDGVVRFKTGKFYKGTPAENVELINHDLSTCDVSFIKDKDYLVFATYDEHGTHLTTDVCLGTHRLDAADKDIEYLESPGEVLPESMNQLKPPDNPNPPKTKSRRRPKRRS